MHGRIFKEEQSYRGTWVMYLIMLLEIPTVIIISVVAYHADSPGNEDIYALGAVFCIMALVIVFILNLKLETRIDQNGVHFKYFPFTKWRNIPKHQIRSVEVISFSPLTDHGGWGIKGNSTTKAYTVIGDMGLLLDINEKKKIVIGTQKSQELSDFIEYWMED